MMAAQSSNTYSGVSGCLRFFARPLAIVSIWLIAVGFFGTAYIVAGKRQTRSFEILDFTAAFAVEAAISAVIALILGGKKRWAVEATLSMLILMLTPIGGAYALFWLAPTPGQYLPGTSVPDFLSLRRELTESAFEIAKLTIPTATVLGIMIGAVAGLLLVLASRRPQFAGWLVVGLLLACVIGSVHIDAFRRVTDVVVKARMNGSNSIEYAWFMTGELVSAMGATAGAVVGAVISCGAVRMDGRKHRTG
jgi:hypothetical protein